MKPCLVYHPNDDVSFAKPWVRPLVEQYFDIEQYDPDRTYDPKRHLALLTRMAQIFRPAELRNLWKQGLKIVVDYLWESDVERTPFRKPHYMLTLHCPNWMWYYSNLEFNYLDQANYRPAPTHQHSFLMLMHNIRWHRDLALAELDPVLDTALYSYMQREIYIAAADVDRRHDPNWSRHLNPQWYNDTCFSTVVETFMSNTVNPRGMRTEVSEKIFKPLAYQHPFVVFGSVDTLKYLHQQGFETFDNIFDESYDSIEDDYDRFAAVKAQVFSGVQRWRNGWENSSETQRRLQHNQQHFYSNDLVRDRFVREIINPVLEFANDPGAAR